MHKVIEFDLASAQGFGEPFAIQCPQGTQFISCKEVRGTIKLFAVANMAEHSTSSYHFMVVPTNYLWDRSKFTSVRWVDTFSFDYDMLHVFRVTLADAN